MASENFDQSKVAANTDAEKAAMLKLAAQGGQNAMGQAAATGSAVQAVAQNEALAQLNRSGVSAVSGNPGYAAAAGAANQNQSNYYQGLSAALGQNASNFQANLGAAGAQYADQLNAAIPVAHEQTQRELNSLDAAAAQAAQERAMKLEMMNLQKQQMEMSMANSQAGAANDSAKLALERDQLGLARDEFEANKANGGKPLDDAQRRSKALDSIMADIQGGPSGAGAQALAMALANAKDSAQANVLLNQLTSGGVDFNQDGKIGPGEIFTTPHGNRLNADYLRQFIGRYYGA